MKLTVMKTVMDKVTKDENDSNENSHGQSITYPLPVACVCPFCCALTEDAADEDDEDDNDDVEARELGLELRTELELLRILLAVGPKRGRLSMFGLCLMCGRRDRMLGRSGAWRTC